MPGRGLEELDLTGEEVERLTNAFKDERFRTLFAEYAAELNDPEQRAIYEAEVTALERQRGVEARFLHPTPGWVLRTSQAGSRRCYINICSNPLVGRPEARQEPGGSCWLLPHCLAPGREHLSRSHPRGPHRLVYDVVFHPETLRLAASLAQFRRLVNDTALETLEKKFSLELDRANAVPLRRTKYKGIPQATLLRTPLPGGAQWRQEEGAESDDSPLPHFPSPYAYPPPKPQYETPTPFSPPPKVPPAPAATTPKWTLRHRSYVDLQDYRNSRDSVPSPVPRELVVTIELPLLNSASQAQLEILGQELQLDSQLPAAYHLRLPLPYPVDDGRGRATFNKAKKQLVVVLPVLRKPDSESAFSAQTPQEATTTSPESEGQQQEERATISDEDGSEPSDTEQALGVHSASVSSAALPASESSPAVPTRNDTVNSSVPLDAHMRTSCKDVELPVQTAGIDSSVPCASTFSGALPVCNENIHPGAPSLTRSSSNVTMYKQPEGTSSDSLPPFLGSDSNVESLAHPVSLVNTEHLCNISKVELPLCPDSMVPCTRAPDNSVEHSEIAESIHDCCSLDKCSVFSSSSDTACSSFASHTEHSDLCPGKRDSGASMYSVKDCEIIDGPLSFCNDDPLKSPESPLCPPFHCSQDENTVLLLLQVPGILPQSFKGEVDINRYRASFANKDSVSYIFHLQFLPENKLTSPEIEINISPNNVFITLAKSRETTGIWTKLYFGSSYDNLQERWFLTENNADTFLNNLERISCSSSNQSDIEHQPLIEVLDISETKSQIRVKQLEENSSPEPGKKGKEDNENECDNKLSTDAENCPEQTKNVLGLFTTMETMEQVGKESSHCQEDPSLTGPETLQINESRESELSNAIGQRALSTVQAQLNQEQPVPISQGEEVDVHSESSQNKLELNNRPAPIVLKETNMQDGSVNYISCHTTKCAITLQNALLYELD